MFSYQMKSSISQYKFTHTAVSITLCIQSSVLYGCRLSVGDRWDISSCDHVWYIILHKLLNVIRGYSLATFFALGICWSMKTAFTLETMASSLWPLTQFVQLNVDALRGSWERSDTWTCNDRYTAGAVPSSSLRQVFRTTFRTSEYTSCSCNLILERRDTLRRPCSLSFACK